MLSMLPLRLDVVEFLAASSKVYSISVLTVVKPWAQIHRYCLKIYPKICHKIIIRQKLCCCKIIL